jgi:hypothetical protein
MYQLLVYGVDVSLLGEKGKCKITAALLDACKQFIYKYTKWKPSICEILGSHGCESSEM